MFAHITTCFQLLKTPLRQKHKCRVKFTSKYILTLQLMYVLYLSNYLWWPWRGWVYQLVGIGGVQRTPSVVNRRRVALLA